MIYERHHYHLEGTTDVMTDDTVRVLKGKGGFGRARRPGAAEERCRIEKNADEAYSRVLWKF